MFYPYVLLGMCGKVVYVAHVLRRSLEDCLCSKTSTDENKVQGCGTLVYNNTQILMV